MEVHRLGGIFVHSGILRRVREVTCCGNLRLKTYSITTLAVESQWERRDLETHLARNSGQVVTYHCIAQRYDRPGRFAPLLETQSIQTRLLLLLFGLCVTCKFCFNVRVLCMHILSMNAKHLKYSCAHRLQVYEYFCT
jgi:hypothetical protein